MTLSDVQNAINGIVQRFTPQDNKPPISPLGGSDTLNTPGLQYYSAMQQAMAQPQPPSNFVPKTIQYPGAQTPSPTPVKSQQQNPIQQALSQLINPNRNQQPQAQADTGAPQGASDYEKQAAQVFQKAGVPPEAGLGIWAMEGRGKTINPNNPYNIGAYDNNPQNANAYGFKDPMEGTKAAAAFMAGDSPYQTNNVKQIFKQALDAYKKSGNPTDYLKKISGTYSSNPNYWQTIIQTPEYQRWAYAQ